MATAEHDSIEYTEISNKRASTVSFIACKYSTRIFIWEELLEDGSGVETGFEIVLIIGDWEDGAGREEMDRDKEELDERLIDVSTFWEDDDVNGFVVLVGVDELLGEEGGWILVFKRTISDNSLLEIEW